MKTGRPKIYVSFQPIDILIELITIIEAFIKQ